MRSHGWFAPFLILSISANIALAYALWKRPGEPPSTFQGTQTYPLLSKRIFIEDQNDMLINFIPLRTAMREYIGKQKELVGVYFEYLPSGISVGVNDTMESQAGSLMKIPVVMGAYRQMEKGVLKKTDTLTIQKENLNDKFGELWKKGEGTTITVEEAIRQILIYSDNTALNVLRSALPQEVFFDVLAGLDIRFQIENQRVVISPKSYSSILRSLYLSSYLSNESSNEVLDTLTRTVFSDKIAAGVPSHVKVAHKIGVFTSIAKDVAFSDCGIVYVPKRPYILCVMVKSDEETSQKHMAYISKMVYGYIAAVRGGN